MAMQFTLIVPPAFHAQLGLMIGAGERLHRGKLWRVEIWPSDTWPRVFKDGRQIPLARIPEHAAKLANAVVKAFAPVT